MLLALMLFAGSKAAAAPLPVRFPDARPGLQCPSGGRAIGAPIAHTFIAQILEVVSRDAPHKVVGWIYAGGDGRDYLDLSASDPQAQTVVLKAGDLDPAKTYMRYCFAAPWMGGR